MAQYDEKWGECIRQLLEDYGCATGRLAEKFTGGVLSHGYITRMMDGLKPEYDSAVRFLSCFDREKAMRCLEAGGYPIPNEWLAEDPVKAVDVALRTAGSLSDASKKRVADYVQQLIEEERAKQEKGDG